MSSIRILPEAVANKIAAGEVVERPASVVKELLENSLDAGAGRIEIEVEAGGKRRIHASDDGCGMGRDDALLAFERHATSKIRSADDLFAIATLGFRGEALPSIAAVSRLVLRTRAAAEESGTQIEMAGGKLRDVSEVARPPGTEIEVRDLFFNTPARRKFLRSESTELGHIAALVTHYALAHPHKHFRLASLTNEILKASPVQSLRERIYQVMGARTLEEMVELAPIERRLPAMVADDDETGGAPAETLPAKVMGFVSRPEIQKLNRNNIYFFVNRRLTRERLILHAITEAYRHILPSNVFPVALVFLELPATEVDVNVHPSKTEVRFRHSSFIHDLVRDTIRQGLIAAQPVAAFPSERKVFRPLPAGVGTLAPAPREIFGDEHAMDASPSRALAGGGGLPAGHAGFRLAAPSAAPATLNLPLDGADRTPPAAEAFEPLLAPAAPEDSGAAVSEFPSDLRPLGQVEDSFIVATNAQGLFIIDQHVAHERVLFEHLLRLRREKRAEGQRLLLPIVVELKPEQQVTYRGIADELNSSGFEVEPFGQRTVAVKTAPAEIATGDVEHLLVEILDGVGAEARALSLESLRSKIAASVACHAAIKVNMALDRKKMEWLLAELANTQCPMNCPHGRPIVLRYTLKEIQRAFKRI